MADVKTITVNNVKYSVKDEVARASLADVVHKTGEESIGGPKTFTNILHAVAPAADSNDNSVPTTAWVRSSLGLDYADPSLSNLNSTGQNITEWSSNVSNCVIEAPNNIKYNLENGVFTLLAGSKVYVPDGPDVYREVVIPDDISYTFTSSNATAYFFVIGDGSGLVCWQTNGDAIYADSWPTGTGHGIMFWDTTANTIKYTNNDGASWSAQLSFPICKIENTDTKTTKVEDVFDSMFFMGCRFVVLPGVKVAVPNGKNPDGTYKSIIVNVNSVKSVNLYNRNNDFVFISNNGSLDGWRADRYFTNEYPKPTSGRWYKVYDKNTNEMWESSDGGAYHRVQHATLARFYKAANNYSMPYPDSQDKPTPYEIKRTFKPIERFDVLEMLNEIYPVGAIYLETSNTGVCPLEFVMRGTKWQLVSSNRALWGGNGTNGNNTISAGLPDIWGKQPNVVVVRNSGSGEGALKTDSNADIAYTGGGSAHTSVSKRNLQFRASLSNSIYGRSGTVQPPAYCVNVWRRIA